MNDPYYRSAEEAASGLGLPLLISATSSPAVPRSGARLSAHAPDPVLSTHLYGRLGLPAPPASTAVWIASPPETVEHLSWAVGVAEQASRTGRTAFVVDLDRSPTLKIVAGGNGHPLPPPVLARLAEIGVSAAAGWVSDLQGVRVVLPASRLPEGEPLEAPASWLLAVARSLPETTEEIARIVPGIDGVILAAGIRDHAREELQLIVQALRSAAAPLLGLVAMGPVPQVKRTPLERWERIQKPVSEQAPAETGTARAGEPTPAEAREAVRVATAVEEPDQFAEGVELPAATIDLVSGWQRRPRRKERTGTLLLVLGLLLIAAATTTVLLRPELLSRFFRAEEEAVLPSEGIEEGEGGGVAASTPAEIGEEPDAQPPEDLEAASQGFAPAGQGFAPAGPGFALADSSEILPEAPEPFPFPSAAEVVENTTYSIPVAWADTFVVHVSSFRRRADAIKERELLRRAGLMARIVPVEIENRGRWDRVVIGAYPDSISAARAAERLREENLVSFAQVLGSGGLGNARRAGDR